MVGWPWQDPEERPIEHHDAELRAAKHRPHRRIHPPLQPEPCEMCGADTRLTSHILQERRLLCLGCWMRQ